MKSQGSYRYFPALLACFMALALFLPSITDAKTLYIEEVVDIAQTKLLPDEEFEAKTELLEETPFDVDALSFSVRLPKGWVSNLKIPVDMFDTKNERELSGVVTRYVSPPLNHLRSTFSVETANLEFNIPTKYWFTNYTLSHGYTLEAVTIHSKNKIEAVYVDVDGDNTSAVRIMVFRSGKRMIIVRYSAPMARFNTEKVMQEQVLASFSLARPEAVPVERNKTYGFLTKSVIKLTAKKALIIATRLTKKAILATVLVLKAAIFLKRLSITALIFAQK